MNEGESSQVVNEAAPRGPDWAVVASFRATLHRATLDTIQFRRDGFETVRGCVAWLEKHWPELDDQTRATVQRELARALRHQFTPEELNLWQQVATLPAHS
jgi:hypothetical protein